MLLLIVCVACFEVYMTCNDGRNVKERLYNNGIDRMSSVWVLIYRWNVGPLTTPEKWAGLGFLLVNDRWTVVVLWTKQHQRITLQHLQNRKKGLSHELTRHRIAFVFWIVYASFVPLLLLAVIVFPNPNSIRSGSQASSKGHGCDLYQFT